MFRVKTSFRLFAFGRVPLFLALLGVAACSMGDEGQPVGMASATVFEGARLIAGDGGQVIEDAAFVIEDGRFTQVGRRGAVNVPEGAGMVDLNGKTVVPAFINAHMHLSDTREERISQLRQNAYYGSALVVSLGSDAGDVAFSVRDEIIPGAARSLTAGRGITRPEPGRSEVPYWINTEEEARAAVQALAERGVDIVKVWVDDRSGQYEKLTPQLYGAIIDEAHQHDLLVTAHIWNLEDAKGLLRAGVDAFAHGVRDQDVDEEFLRLIQGRPDLVYVPNLPDPGIARDLSWLSGTVAPDELDRLQESTTDRPEVQAAFGIQARNLARVNEVGVRVAFGTDGSSPWAAHLEIEDMVSAGMTPAEVIVAATQSSADLMGLDDSGTIAVGNSADFIVLDGNPLEDIANTRLISMVYLRGLEVDREGLSAQLLAASNSGG